MLRWKMGESGIYVTWKPNGAGKLEPIPTTRLETARHMTSLEGVEDDGKNPHMKMKETNGRKPK